MLDQTGGENLLGKGDVLFRPPGASRLRRLCGACVTDGEKRRVTDHIREFGPPDCIDNLAPLSPRTAGALRAGPPVPGVGGVRARLGQGCHLAHPEAVPERLQPCRQDHRGDGAHGRDRAPGRDEAEGQSFSGPCAATAPGGGRALSAPPPSRGVVRGGGEPKEPKVDGWQEWQGRRR
jgi:hypothetical protein